MIIDDFGKLQLNIHHQNIFLENVLKLTNKLILISDSTIKYDEARYIEISNYLQYEILPLGNFRRGELIEKWVSLGRVETIESKELYDECDSITHHMDSIIRKNVLPCMYKSTP